ncbi:hypothetical protein CC78DRAFT_108210 [Lojkania enalia]|uniref:Ankyrin repeat protein n=1 Tax=Lojkania enalia TaxID=147567 RepID=A0A9P4KER2_9PLEO|nr:hypothetical protein CC78DRAFT_108210 [Didymosphaeria enalia]
MTSTQHSPPPPTIDLLLNLIDTRPQSILNSLSQHPQLAAASDAHGYSLVHAAVSYNQLEVLRELVQKHNVDVNLRDEDDESPLFAAENAGVASFLVQELGADWTVRNTEGKTAEEKIGGEEGEANEVYQYLRRLRIGYSGAARADLEAPEKEEVHPPPPLPDGVKINMGTMEEDAAGTAPDPEVRRRIEELAARDDFQTEEGQRKLRELVTEVVTGIGSEQTGRSVRRRLD